MFKLLRSVAYHNLAEYMSVIAEEGRRESIKKKVNQIRAAIFEVARAGENKFVFELVNTSEDYTQTIINTLVDDGFTVQLTQFDRHSHNDTGCYDYEITVEWGY